MTTCSGDTITGVNIVGRILVNNLPIIPDILLKLGGGREHYSVISLGTILGEIAFIKTSDGGQFGGKSQQFWFKNVVVK